MDFNNYNIYSIIHDLKTWKKVPLEEQNMNEAPIYNSNIHLLKTDTPHQISNKWRFFRFATIYQNISIKNTILSSFSFFYTLLLTPLAAVYPILWTSTDKAPNSEVTDITFFPNCENLKRIFPGIISSNVLNSISIILILLPLISFICCFYYSEKLIHLHPFLSQQIITIVYPYNCVVFCNYVIRLAFANKDFSSRAVTIFYIIFFVLHLFLYMALIYIDNNSIISPNKITGEWFIGFTSYMPLIMLLVMFTSIQTQNLGQAAYYSLFIISFLVLLIAIYYVAYEVPMLNNLLNSMIASHYTVTLIILALDFIKIDFQVSTPKYLLCFVPVVFSLLSLFIRFITDRRRIVIQQFLDRFDNQDGNYTVSAIAATLESLTTERQVRLLIYEGFQSGNKTVISSSFVQFCLERFPTSTWMVSYVSFLFAVNWGTNDIIYRFMLHTLSLDYFGIRNLQMYQAIYCLMQSSEKISPVIARELDDYRCEVVQFASIHRAFWRSVITNDSDAFHDTFFAYHSQLKKLSRILRNLTMKYPYNSSVACENALFYADMQHNFHKSSECYSRAAQLLNSRRTFIVNDLFYNYSMMFPISKPTLKEENDLQEKISEELRFISLLESHEHALRYMTIVSTNDEYLQAMSHAFSVPTNYQHVEISFEKVRTIILYSTFVISVLFFVSICLTILRLVYENEKERDVYELSCLMMERMILFRNEVHLARQDVRLLSNVLTEDYNGILNSSIYYNISDDDWKTTVNGLYILAIRHVNDIEIALTRHVLRFNARTLYQDIPFTLPNCNEVNCTLSYLYSGLHFILFFMLNNKDGDRDLNDRLISSLDTFSIPLVELCNNVFNQMVHRHNETIYNNIRDHERTYIEIIIVIYCILLFLIILLVYSMHSMRQNMFGVIRTIQSSMLKMISSLFDKMLTLEQKQKQVSHDYTFLKSILYLFLSFAVTTFCLVFLLAINIQSKSTITVANNSLDVMVDPSNITSFATFMAAVLEYIVRDGINRNGVLQTSSINYMALTVYQSCLYFLFNDTCFNCYTKTKFYENNPRVVMWTVTYVFLVFAVIFLIFFIFNLLKVIDVSKSVEEIMKFVPQGARKSNPVLAKIMAGKRTPFSEISEFAENCKTTVLKYDFFVTFCMDPLENIIETKGDVNDYFPFKPQKLSDIRGYIMNHSNDNPDSIKQFFEQKKPLDTRSVSLDNDKEISLTFSRKGAILLVKNDVHHHTSNNRQRIFEQLQSTVKDGMDRRKASSFPQAILIMLQINNKKVLTDVCNKLETIGKVLDTRFRRIVCTVQMEKTKEFVDMINYLKEHYKGEIKGVCHFGGIVSVLQSSMTIEKTRVFGPTYDEAKVMISRVPNGEIIFTEKLLSAIQ